MSASPLGQPRQHFVQCHSCDCAVTATERGVVEEHESEQGLRTLYILASCDECHEAMLLAKEYFGSVFGWSDITRLWPFPARALSTEIPKSLRTEQAEARKCFDAKAYTATVVMVRRTLEGVCGDHGMKKAPLFKMLTKMKEDGQLDHRLFNWAQALRVLGNEGAHYTGRQVSREDASDALAFAEAMLDYLYVLAAKFKEFTERRSTHSANTQPAPVTDDGSP